MPSATTKAAGPHVKLNPSQERVLSSAGAITVVLGPPGTGKSQTLVTFIQARLLDDEAALVTARGNDAVESLVSKFADLGMAFVVLGNPQRMGESARRYSLAEQMEQDESVQWWAQKEREAATDEDAEYYKGKKKASLKKAEVRL